MSSVEDHYRNLLARHYTWMFGVPFASRVAEQRAILEEALEPCEGVAERGMAVDLGSGPGFQTLALASMGYAPVVAVDTSPDLLEELRSHQGAMPIQTICGDLARLPEFVPPARARVLVCMGDTITHLASRDAVTRLLRDVYDALAPGGTFVVTWRDLSAELSGLDRFIPVYSDEQRVMTCFLEFDREEAVLVHDLVYSREGSGWRLEKSSYRKLRLPVDWLESAMTTAGLIVRRGQAGRLLRLVAQKR